MWAPSTMYTFMSSVSAITDAVARLFCRNEMSPSVSFSWMIPSRMRPSSSGRSFSTRHRPVAMNNSFSERAPSEIKISSFFTDASLAPCSSFCQSSLVRLSNCVSSSLKSAGRSSEGLGSFPDLVQLWYRRVYTSSMTMGGTRILNFSKCWPGGTTTPGMPDMRPFSLCTAVISMLLLLESMRWMRDRAILPLAFNEKTTE
mmetsp:Transcript_45691/g.114997  ORF Transcript_45691/g.114997 Transcript_45691/m.114997 type:complete len:201 (+) Transcript_45691:185-787(+)